MPDAVFSQMLTGLERLPVPSTVAGANAPIFTTHAARSLHAALLLQSLPQQALPFAPQHMFGYISRVQPEPLDVHSHAASAAHVFFAHKLATDERHEIIPARMCKHLRGVLRATQQPEEHRAADLDAQIREFVSLFDTDIQPLATAACACDAASPADYRFLDGHDVRTGFRKEQSRMLMFKLLGM